MALEILERLKANAKQAKRTIALGDATDDRMLHAARIAIDEQIADIILVGEEKKIREAAKSAGVVLEGIAIADIDDDVRRARLSTHYFEKRKGKLEDEKAADHEVKNNALLYAALLASVGEVNGVLAGSLSTTGDLIRAALKGIGTAKGIEVLSSMFLMCFPKIPGHREQDLIVGFGDCAVVPDPTETQLADIAYSTARTYTRLSQLPAIAAMLSFSTKGSAHTPATEKVLQALEIAKQKYPDLVIDGEMQFDAAFVPEVGSRKAPQSAVAGKANVFIFPDLNAGNIGYKIAERLGMGQAIGPVLQGLAKPMNDLSRGAHISDIVNMIAITALQA